MQPRFKKIVLLGTSGSGKTTFLKHFSQNFDGRSTEVRRNIELEASDILNTFSIIDKQQYLDSTTTISMNIQSLLFYTTHSNQFSFIESNTDISNVDSVESIYPVVFVDAPGQERFDFMQDILIKGADSVIIMADGTNIQSIERITHFINLTRQEEARKGREIPILIFINKSDMKKKGLYIEIEFLNNILPDQINLEVFETTNLSFESFLFPLRIILTKFNDLPIKLHQIIA
ncbi:MAG: ATP/GTP-binding protein [Candidatus Heimdallarchaeota archaeon]|nr:ATP/GTP-binding protein [Candidatus Heimdallarchaeota archaeon]